MVTKPKSRDEKLPKAHLVYVGMHSEQAAKMLLSKLQKLIYREFPGLGIQAYAVEVALRRGNDGEFYEVFPIEVEIPDPSTMAQMQGVVLKGRAK